MSGPAVLEGNYTGLGTPINDCYGNLTATFGTELLRIIPARFGHRAGVTGFSYLPGTTAHTVTFLTVLDEAIATAAAAAAQGVLLFDALPQNPVDGSVLEAADFFLIQHFDGSWGAYKWSSTSGLSVTVTPVLTKNVLANGRICYLGKPADHPNRQFLTVASTLLTISYRAASATNNSEPMLAHSDNGTAAGQFNSLSYDYRAAAAL